MSDEEEARRKKMSRRGFIGAGLAFIVTRIALDYGRRACDPEHNRTHQPGYIPPRYWQRMHDRCRQMTGQGYTPEQFCEWAYQRTPDMPGRDRPHCASIIRRRGCDFGDGVDDFQ